MASYDSQGPESDDGPKTAQQIAAQKKMQMTQAQVDEVVGIMKDNVDKVLQRDGNISELDSKATALHDTAKHFGEQTGKLRRKFWLANMKTIVILGIIGAVILIIILIQLIPADERSKMEDEDENTLKIQANKTVAEANKTAVPDNKTGI